MPAASPSHASQGTLALTLLMFATNLLASFNQSIMNVALDQVARQFSVDLALANWMVLGFTIVTATVITTSATLLKRYGLRRVMLCAYAVSLGGATLGFFSWNFASMLAARLVQAVTVGLSYPIVTSVLMAITPERRVSTVLAINSAVVGVGLAVIPVVAGLLMTWVSLRSIFLVPLALSAALLVLGWFFLHNVFPREHRTVDAVSVGLSFVGLGLLMYGLNEVTRSVGPSLALMGVGTAALALFAWRQFKIPEPLLDLRPFRCATFTVGEVIVMMAFTSSMYQSLLIPLYLEGVLGRTPFEAGLFLLVPVLCYAAGCFVGGRIGDAHGVWPLVPIAFGVLIAGLGGLALASQAELVPVMLGCSCVAYAGLGLIFPALKARNLDALPKELTSNGSSIHSTLAQITDSVGSALFVGIMAADVARCTAGGMSAAAAHAQGFSHTLVIEIGIVAAALVGALVFSLVTRRRGKRGQAVAEPTPSGVAPTSAPRQLPPSR